MTARRLWLSSVAFIALASASGVAAQAVATAAQAPSTLGEVVVTARRRAENLQKVPVAVTAFTSQTIEQKGIKDQSTLADFTPSMMTITGGQPSEAAFFALRGQGPAFGSVPGVVTYFSEVANPVGIDGRVGTYFDLASVQVLAGPQGTLFGKNATGGNILFEPARPTDRFEGYLRGEYGNYNDRRLEGAVNLPIIGDKLMLRVAGEIGRRDGYTVDVGPFFAGRKYDNLNYDSVRVSLTARPTDRIELYTVFRYYLSDNNGPGTVLEQLNPATVAAFGAYLPGLADAVANQEKLGVRKVSYDLPEFSKTEYWQVLNHLNVKISDDLQFQNIISYSRFRDHYAYDYDASPFPLGGQSSKDFPVLAPNYFTEEARLQGKALEGALNYTVGVYHDEQTWNSPAGIEDYYVIPVDLLFGPLTAVFVDKNSSNAVFGQATLDVGEATGILHGLSLTGGLRYTWERSETSVQIEPGPSVGGVVDSRYPSYTVSADQALFGNAAHVYVTARDAFKSGGVNAGVPPSSPFATFAPEELQDVEVGLKSEFTAGGVPLRLNMDAYHGDYSNIQRTTPQVVSGVVLNVNESAAKAVIQGFEFTGVAAPFRGLTLTAAYSYIDSKYTKVTPAAEAILQGSAFPYTPRNKITVGGSYDRALGDDVGTLVLSANYTYQSSFSTAQTNLSRVDFLPGYGYVNAEADLTSIGGRPIDIALFVDNLTNATYATGLADFYNTGTTGTVSYTFAPPRMFGVRLRYRFGG
ncbi:MAG TPA: TonB-dependent receptor plug domain-containing protein [Caulobacteraceae bacterium]|nr:TonB-dependent receptor plug domain-containing protein [Caulobacteraceae bacterium]